jgi:hypothetical protein
VANAIQSTSSMRLYDICDRSYCLKYGKHRRKSSRSVPGVPTESQDPALNKVVGVVSSKRPTPILNTNEESISAQAGPRLELVNGKMVVKESSLVRLAEEK